LFNDLDRLQSEQRRLDVEHERLLAERQAEATHLRVEKVAREKLQMRPANPAVTQYVNDTAGGSTR
jgi:cell division protein FtsL